MASDNKRFTEQKNFL